MSERAARDWIKRHNIPQRGQRPVLVSEAAIRKQLEALGRMPRRSPEAPPDDTGSASEPIDVPFRMRGELANLHVTDVDVPAKLPRGVTAIGALQIRNGKGRKDRTVTLNDPACRALKAYLMVRPQCDDPHLFLSKFRRGLGSWGVEDVVKKYLAIAGIDGSPHALRHTFATQHVRRGTKLPVVQAALGHQNLATSSRYVALVREQMDEQLQEHAL